MTEILRFENVSKQFPGVKALDKVSFSVKAGSIHGLLGENGAGKSTLMKILGGDYLPDSGSLLIDGTPRHFANTRSALLSGISIVHQELQLVPDLTVAENLMLGRFPARVGWIDFPKLVERVRSKLNRVGIQIDPRAKVATLSLGQRQMVEISKAIMFDARIIALDEPTSSLSLGESKLLFSLADHLRSEGKAIIYISHRMDEVFRLCDVATVLRDGKLAADFKTLKEVTTDDLVRAMVGREIANIFDYRPRSAGPVRLRVNELHGPGLKRAATFQVRSGEILGFFGLVGAGRSELMHLIYGDNIPFSGEVVLDGKVRRFRHPQEAIKAGVVFCPEDRKAGGIVQGRSVEENINISCRRHFAPFGAWINTRREAQNADQYIKMLRIKTPHRRQDIVNLSGGNQQKTILGRWLAERNVGLLIADEPTRGIDVGAKSEIYHLLYDLAEQGMAIVVVSSELPEVMGICDRILVMRTGQIVSEFPRNQFSEAAILAQALPQRADH